jgi:hypothetical protein
VGATVRIETKAFEDPRFSIAARLLGLADAHHALIKIARVWAWQTEEYTPDCPTYVVPTEILEAFLGPGAGSALVRARLADQEPTGSVPDTVEIYGYRMRGSHGRIEWLYGKRQNGKKGGRPSKREPIGSAPGSQPAECSPTDCEATSNPLTPSPAPAPSESQKRESTPAGARDPGAPQPPAPTPEPGRDVLRNWTLDLRLRRHRIVTALRADGIGANLPPPALVVDASVEARALHLVQRWAQIARDAGRDVEVELDERGGHLLTVLEAQCRARKSLSSLREETCWSPEVVGWAESVTPEEAAAPQRGRGPAAPKRAAGVGRAEPHEPHEYPDGEVTL